MHAPNRQLTIEDVTQANLRAQPISSKPLSSERLDRAVCTSLWWRMPARRRNPPDSRVLAYFFFFDWSISVFTSSIASVKRVLSNPSASLLER